MLSYLHFIFYTLHFSLLSSCYSWWWSFCPTHTNWWWMLLICKLMHCIHMLQFNFHFVCLTFRPLFRILFYCILFFFTFYFLYIFIFICQFILWVLPVNKDFFICDRNTAWRRTVLWRRNGVRVPKFQMHPAVERQQLVQWLRRQFGRRRDSYFFIRPIFLRTYCIGLISGRLLSLRVSAQLIR